MRAVTAGLGLVIVLSWLCASADAKAKRRRPAKKAVPTVATKQTTVGIEKLMGGFKWGMTIKDVLAKLEKAVRAEMEPVIKSTADPMAQDRVRREMMDKIKQLRASEVKFEGKHTSWDVSLVDKEFAHKNGESMIPVWGKRDRRFFFFHNEKLWRLYIAFNSELYAGKTFEDFAQVMETRFGRAERRFTATLSGESKMSHLAWPPSTTTLLRAIDNTGFYGNFCLVLTDKNELPAVRAGRKANSPGREDGDPLVDAVTKGGGGGNEAVGGTEDSVADEGGAGGGSKNVVGGDSSPPPVKKKKVNSKNPLDGIDF